MSITEPCGDPTVETLYAGQTINAGNVTVANDADQLCVTFQTTDGWMIVETHLQLAPTVDGIPQKNGNPIPGQFDYKHEFDFEQGVQNDDFCFSLGEIEEMFDADGCTIVAAHAALKKIHRRR